MQESHLRENPAGNRLFWNIQSDLDCPPLTDQLLQRAEADLGYTLPVAYVTALQERNGGQLKRNFFCKHGQPNILSGENCKADGEHVFWLPSLIGVGGSNGINSRRHGMILNDYLISSRKYPNHSVVFCHMGDAGFFFDYDDRNNNGEPRVKYAFTGSPDNIQVALVADSFWDVLHGLYRRKDDPDFSEFEPERPA